MEMILQNSTQYYRLKMDFYVKTSHTVAKQKRNINTFMDGKNKAKSLLTK